MIIASSHWSDLTEGQQMFVVYLMIGLAVMIAIRWHVRPKIRRGLTNSVDWEPRGEGNGELYWTLFALGLHPIGILIGAVVWPIWIVAILLVRFLR